MTETKWRLLEFLIECRRDGKRVAGYGAPGKGNTLLNYCGIRTDLLEFTVDRNPYKQGQFLPGTHIPIHHPEALEQARPDFILILPWNLKDEIVAQLSHARELGRAVRRPDPGGESHVKVVIFCGGQGLRMREASEAVPKPMVPIGPRPVLWHVMKYYAHFGFTDFILCLGYKAEAIKQFFLTYNEAMANDFVLSNGGAEVHLLKTDIHDWNITFVDTGLRAPIGERLRAVRHLLADDEIFLANYGDTLTDADLPAMIARASEERRRRRASSRSARTTASTWSRWATTAASGDARRDGLRHLDQRRLLRPAPRVPRPARAPARTSSRSRCSACCAAGKVLAQRHEGFWAPMDTLKDQQWLETPARERHAPRGRSGTPTASRAASSPSRASG